MRFLLLQTNRFLMASLCCVALLASCENSSQQIGQNKSTDKGTKNDSQDAPKVQSPESKKRTGTKVVVEEATLSFDGKNVPRKPSLDDLEKLFGKPDRKSDLANIIFTWDQLGIIAYQKPKEKLIHCLAIFYSMPEHKYEPTGQFDGYIQLGKHTFDAESTPSHLESAGFTSPSYAPFLHSIEKSNYSVFCEFSENRISFSYTWK